MLKIMGKVIIYNFMLKFFVYLNLSLYFSGGMLDPALGLFRAHYLQKISEQKMSCHNYEGKENCHRWIQYQLYFYHDL